MNDIRIGIGDFRFYDWFSESAHAVTHALGLVCHCGAGVLLVLRGEVKVLRTGPHSRLLQSSLDHKRLAVSHAS